MMPTGAISSGVDDLKRIRGIGPAIAQRLQTAGVVSFAQLAALSPAEVVQRIGNVSARRIIHEKWIGQARRLAAQRKSNRRRRKPAHVSERLHYATFTVELLLDEENVVHHSKVVHIQSGGEGTWADWSEAKLVSFFVEHAGLPAQQTPPTTSAESVELPVQRPVLPPPLDGALRLNAVEIVASGGSCPATRLRHDGPFEIRLIPDLAGVIHAADYAVEYVAEIYAKRLGDKSRQLIAGARDILLSADAISIPIGGGMLAPGIYRFDAVLTLYAVEQPGSHSITASQKSTLIQVY
jgi:hypothetical protein